VVDPLKVLERLCLLEEGHEMPTPQGAEYSLRLLRQLGIDKRRIIRFTKLWPLLIDDLNVRPNFLEVRHESCRHFLAIRVVRAHRGYTFDRQFCNELCRRPALDGRGGRRPEQVGMKVLRRSQSLRL